MFTYTYIFKSVLPHVNMMYMIYNDKLLAYGKRSAHSNFTLIGKIIVIIFRNET
jgi:hypothetical protein